MNHLKSSIVLLSTLLVFAGSVQADTDAEPGQEKPALTEQWKETTEALGAYTAEQRDKAVKAGRKTLDAMDARLEKMETWTKENWHAMSEEARQKRTKTLKAMRRQRNEVAEWYGAMKHSSSDTWDGVKQGFIKSYEKLQEAYGKAAESFRSEEQKNGQE